MKKCLIYFTICLLALVALSSCSDDNKPVPVPESAPSGYCLMFYASGGDLKHDIILMESAREAAEATGDDVAVTVLFKTSGRAEGDVHNGTRRYTAQDGVLTQDAAFGTIDDFAVTDPASLAEFIRWSAEQYPDRRYLLVVGGNGASFSPVYDLPNTEDKTRTSRPNTRATLADKGKIMTSAQLGDAIRQAGVNLEAIITHSCQQGSIEMLADWEGLADYLLGSPFSIPDFAYDYTSLINDLRQGRSVEETLTRTAHRSINLWQEFHNQGVFGMAIEVTRLRDLTPLWEVLRQTLDLMHGSMEEVNFTSDPPAVYGNTYGKGYMRALRYKYTKNSKDFFQRLRPNNAVDLVSYLHAAFVQSGNMRLAPYINRLDEVIADIVVTHRQTDGKHDYLYNVYTYLNRTDQANAFRERYHSCRFDKLTGWGTFYEDLMVYVDNLPDVQGPVLTPIAEHIIGTWKAVEYSYKVYGEWVPDPFPEGYSEFFTLRPNGEVLKKHTTSRGVTMLDLLAWGDTDDAGYTFQVDDERYKIYCLTEDELEFTLANPPTESGAMVRKILLHRIDKAPKTLADLMVGKWNLSKRYVKVDGKWVELTHLPDEHWCEYTEVGTFSTYTRQDGKEHRSKDMQWKVYEQAGVVLYLPSEDSSAYFRISLKEDGNTMVVNYSENFNPKLEEQTSTEYKDILIKNIQ